MIHNLVSICKYNRLIWKRRRKFSIAAYSHIESSNLPLDDRHFSVSVSSDASSSTDTATFEPKECVISDSTELSRRICERMHKKSFLSFMDILKDSVAIEENELSDTGKDRMLNKHNIINKIARKDKWVTSWLLRIVNSANFAASPFPMHTTLPYSEEISFHATCLSEALHRAKAFIEKGKFTPSYSSSGGNESINEITKSSPPAIDINMLSSKLVDTMPLTSSEELVILVEEFASEEVSELGFRTRLLEIFGLHVDHVYELTALLEINTPQSFRVRIQSSISRRNYLISEFAAQLDALVEVGSRKREVLKIRSKAQKAEVDTTSSSNDDSSKPEESRRRLTNPYYCLRLTLVCRGVMSTMLRGESSRRRELTHPSKMLHADEGYDDTSIDHDISAAASPSLKRFFDYNHAKRKIFLCNLPPAMTIATLTDALRNIGDVEKGAIWLFHYDRAESNRSRTISPSALSFLAPKSELESSSPRSGSTISVAEENRKLSLLEAVDRELEGDARYQEHDHDHDGDVDHHGLDAASASSARSSSTTASVSSTSRNPLAAFADINLSSKQLIRKKIAQDDSSDSHAFVVMADDAGFNNATREDLRVFGISMKGHSTACRISRASIMKSLEVELLGQSNLSQIINMLSSYLGPQLEYSGHMKPHIESLQPVFVHIDFISHADAWEAYDLLQQGVRDGLPIRVTWIKTKWYYSVAEKDRMWRLKVPDVQTLADEGRKDMELESSKHEPI